MIPGWSAQRNPSVNQSTTATSYAYPASNPAYTAVPVRQGFGHYPPNMYEAHGSVLPLQPPPVMPAAPAQTTASQPASAQAKGKVEWPESVRNYVQRSFMPSNDDPSVSRTDLEAKLKETIGSAKQNGTLLSIDWDSMPLPQALVKSERETLALSSEAFLKSKKRKSAEFAPGDPSWRSTNKHAALDDRITFSSSSNSQSDAASKRKRRFEAEYKAAQVSESPPPPSAGPIVGTSETLEKRYLRLTAPPVPANVRPEKVLRQTLDLLKNKWREENNYAYICDQFKSLRQDLTVQRIKNEFTVSVYEIHARIALEKGDIGEYNQCQTQLRSLHGLGLKGNHIEFKAYRILYFIHTANRSGLNDTIADLTKAEKEERPIKHALDVRSALTLGNYHRFFQLYMDTPHMGAYLMDMFVMRERLAALCKICRIYKPDVRLRFITEELAFESDADTAQFICDYKADAFLESRSEDIIFMTAKAGNVFEAARASAFQTVDIKGQI